MKDATVNIYALQADAKERDPIVTPGEHGRADVANGERFGAWGRFNDTTDVVWIVTPEGKDAWLTRRQANLLDLLLTYVDNGTTTIRSLARELKCSPSTISRGIVKLASLGLVAALIGRGRYAGALIFLLPKDGSLQRFRDAAKAKVRQWSQAAQERLSRLKINVAPYALERGRSKEVDSLYYYLTTITKGATLKEWTADELADIR